MKLEQAQEIAERIKRDLAPQERELAAVRLDWQLNNKEEPHV